MKFLLWVMIFLLFIGGMVATALWRIPWLPWVSCGFLALCYVLLEERDRFGGTSSPPPVSLRRFWWMVGIYSVFFVGALGTGIFECAWSTSCELTAFVPFGFFFVAGMHKGFIYTNEHGTWRLSYFEVIFVELPYVFWKRRQPRQKK